MRDGVVHRIWNGGEGRIIGFLDDAANLGDALLTLYEATGEPRYFTVAARPLRTHRRSSIGTRTATTSTLPAIPSR